MKICCKPKHGFTVIDLMMSVALAGIVVALLLPTVQDMRANARNVACSNRLATIGLEAQAYEVKHTHLPGMSGPVGAIPLSEFELPENVHNQYASPFSLASANRDRFMIGQEFWDYDNILESPFFDVEGYGVTAAYSSRNYRCPARSVLLRNIRPTNGIYLAATPVYSDESRRGFPDQDLLGILTDGDTTNVYGESNYVGSLGACSGGENRLGFLGPFRGMITPHETVTMQDITDGDGLSTTIMYGENIGEVREDINTGVPYREYRWGWLNGGAVRGRGHVAWAAEPPIGNVPTPSFPNGGDPRNTILGRATLSPGIGFGSNHACGVNFVFGDGSTLCVSRDVDWLLLYAWFGGYDGGIIPGDG